MSNIFASTVYKLWDAKEGSVRLDEMNRLKHLQYEKPEKVKEYQFKELSWNNV